MFDNELMSDVSFACGESSHLLHAHKYVLATSSAVFYAMFYGNLAQGESTIRITDADEEAFKEFLRFLYTDDCEITAENAMVVMYLAKKYLILSLAEKCCEVLVTSIEPENVFLVLEQAVQFDESDLEAKCWDIVSRNTLECMNSEAFCNIGSTTLSTLLKSETFAIAEVDLFTAVLKWVDNECAKQSINVEEDKMARRRILGDIVYEIHFLEMSLENFAKHVPAVGLLTEAEIISIFQAFNGVVVAGLQWKDQKKRLLSRVVAFSRFETSNVTGLRRYGGNADALTLTVNKAVLFHGIRLFGNEKGGEYEIKFSVRGEGDVTGTYTSEQDGDHLWGFDVMLSKPISVKPGEEFTIIAKIKGPESHRGTKGKSSVKVDDVIVTFKDAFGLSTNATSREKGQFYKVYLSPT
jgi:hypothetical protein